MANVIPNNPDAKKTNIPDTKYIDPNSKEVKNSVDIVNYMPNRKFTIILLMIFLITAISALLLTNFNTKKARESIKAKQLLLPTPTILPIK